MRFLLVAMALWTSHPAAAQDPTLGAFDIASVLVTTFEPASDALEEDATLLHRLIAEALAADHLVLDMSEVPPFLGYDATVYLQGCPPGRYVDCAFVVGQRGGADWVLGGQLRAQEGQLLLTLSVVEVASSTLLLQVDLPFTGEDDAATAAAIGTILDSVMAGEAETTDVRLTVDDSLTGGTVDAAALEAAAVELDELEARDGQVERSERRRGKATRLSPADLDVYRGRDVEPPWALLSLTPDQWRRWKNSGLSLGDWRDRLAGRQASLLLSVSAITVQQGPWTQQYEAWYAIDDFNLELSDQYVMQDLAPGLLKSWEFQLAGGILPWLEVGVFGGPRLVTYRYRIQRIVDGADSQRLVSPDEKGVTTWHLGGRVGFFPMPSFPARPSLQLGVLYWWGAAQANTLAVPDGIVTTEAPGMLLLQASPGVEVDVGKVLRLWARVDVEVPVWRRVEDPTLFGGAALVGRPSPDLGDEAVSVGGSIGATVRIRLTRRGGRTR